MNSKRISLVTAVIILAVSVVGAHASSVKSYELSSPSSRICATISCGDSLTYSVSYDGRDVISRSPLSVTLADGICWGHNMKVARAERSSVDNIVATPFAQSSEMTDRYNGLAIKTSGGWSIEFRAYDDGVAYRFVYDRRRPVEVRSEQVDVNFPSDFTAMVPYVRTGTDWDLNSQFFNSFENSYTTSPLSLLNPGRLAFLPLCVDVGDGVKAVITETDLIDYPGLYFINPDRSTSLKGIHAPYPVSVADGGYNNIQSVVTARAPYIARIEGRRSLPWRIIVLGNDREIAASNLAYLLAEPSRIADTSWIKPGKVAWEWWNHWNITGVDFEAGINTATYCHYVDFAAENGIEYVILDDGWAVGKGEDLMKVNPDINLDAIISHANRKNVGIILWAGFRALERDLENVCRHYSAMGVKGFKIDFEDRDDQLMTAFNYKAAEVAARYKLILDIHGSYKPAGIHRTWPNVLNIEGVNGLENVKWAGLDYFDIITYDVTIPFIRQVAGPLDYTPGAMNNASRQCFRVVNESPMSPGTRAHQMALYVIHYAPLAMLCDSPTAYRREQPCTDFIASVPTVWDESIVLDGKVGEYIVMARRKGAEWYVGGITGWTPRDIEVDLSPLRLDALSRITIFTDGRNSSRNGNDYVRSVDDFDSSKALKVYMAPGGGFAVRISAR